MFHKELSEFYKGIVQFNLAQYNVNQYDILNVKL